MPFPDDHGALSERTDAGYVVIAPHFTGSKVFHLLMQTHNRGHAMWSHSVNFFAITVRYGMRDRPALAAP